MTTPAHIQQVVQEWADRYWEGKYWPPLLRT